MNNRLTPLLALLVTHPTGPQASAASLRAVTTPHVEFQLARSSASRGTHAHPANFSQNPTGSFSGEKRTSPLQESSLTQWTSRLRIRSFSEFMTPVFHEFSKHQVPSPQGGSAFTSNIFNIAWMDYEIAPRSYLLLWQRFFINSFASLDPGGLVAVARNPRFAYRRTQIWDHPDWSTTYDFYLQPGLAPENRSMDRTLEVGFRASNNFHPQGSDWTLGLTFELTANPQWTSPPASVAGNRVDYYGSTFMFVEHKINDLFASEHYLSVNFQHFQGSAPASLQLDLPMPYTQNGIGISLSPQFWVAVFINNYVIQPPTLKTTWASLWLSMTLF